MMTHEAEVKNEVREAAEDLLLRMLGAWERKDIADFLRSLAVAIEGQLSASAISVH